jgi:hypothetical protein
MVFASGHDFGRPGALYFGYAIGKVFLSGHEVVPYLGLRPVKSHENEIPQPGNR